MRHYLDLIPISAKVHRKQSRMTRICIILAVFLVTVIFGMADMEMRAQKLQSQKSDGGWHAGFKEITGEQAGIIASRPEIKASAWYDVLNYRLDEGYQLQGNDAVICGFDEELLSMFTGMELEEGEFPKDTHSAVFTKSVKEQLGLKTGDTIWLTVPRGESIELTVCGFTGDTSMLTEKDAFGIFLNTEAFRTLLSAESSETYEGIFYVTFTPYCSIQKALSDIQAQLQLSDQQVTQNTKLLALMLQSKDPYMMQLYLTAGVLAVLVAIAGTLMIAGSLNSNVVQRTEFFGMMRCLGATQKQVIRFVRREALSWCKTAIPLGIAAGTAVIWLLCALLEFLSPSIFGEMPDFGISWLGLISGVLIGLITVLLAAGSPAKKASRVSPVAAVSGNAGTIQAARKAASTTFFQVDTALGIHHAKGSRKNFILMIGSFAFSIILFLSFRSAVDFMNHAITPLKPYSPDLSVLSPDNTCAIAPDLAESYAVLPFVEKVYGRSFAYNIPVKIHGQTKRVNLISYETYQFQWAEDMLLEGTIDDTENGSSVLTVFHKENPLNLGSTITMDSYSEGQPVNVKVSGILSDSPFSREPGVETVICSQKLFQQLTGESNYTIIDVQFNSKVTDNDVAHMRADAGDSVIFSDQRIKNSETMGAYYSFSLFIYGFLAVIALISVFYIINSIAMSVSARLRQYGAMRAIGMSDRQLIRMISAEAATYALFGIFFGCLIGLPINKLLFERLVTYRWGDAWYVPVGSLLVIILVIAGSAILAVRGPARKIRGMSVVDTISAE
ncbi:ABC transporter permease [Lactonifactor longoviformis]|uniref:Putative ABC transport system permease protein n=1 Tax=Lactonifactor longoviformis DSM 17459 TaxID=1122155 RepID=A0A1M5C6A0_9CLOT|nr:ABC transporter permease [Lactonifactor longoviformis]POP31180.1 ABC transporter permease [Lactonifactor longoviformis]SHF50269.1 putative ABC transport system permease protein [Lactonifactor longoviformis DSM 17459]